MAKILGKNDDNLDNPKKPNIDLSKAKPMKCESCGENVFMSARRFYRISKLVTGTKTDVVVPVEVNLCSSCGEVNNELLPDEFK